MLKFKQHKIDTDRIEKKNLMIKFQEKLCMEKSIWAAVWSTVHIEIIFNTKAIHLYFWKIIKYIRTTYIHTDTHKIISWFIDNSYVYIGVYF